MRYIDADKIQITAERGMVSEGLIFIPMVDAQRSIDATPTADVVEVRHGEWKATIIENSDKVFRTGAPHCSLCSRQAQHRTPFCPHCGAKMDGERR